MLETPVEGIRQGQMVSMQMADFVVRAPLPDMEKLNTTTAKTEPAREMIEEIRKSTERENAQNESNTEKEQACIIQMETFDSSSEQRDEKKNLRRTHSNLWEISHNTFMNQQNTLQHSSVKQQSTFDPVKRWIGTVSSVFNKNEPVIDKDKILPQQVDLTKKLSHEEGAEGGSHSADLPILIRDTGMEQGTSTDDNDPGGPTNGNGEHPVLGDELERDTEAKRRKMALVLNVKPGDKKASDERNSKNS